MTYVPAFDDNQHGNAIWSRLSAGVGVAGAQIAVSFTLAQERRVTAKKCLCFASFSVFSCIAIWALMVTSLDLAFNEQSEVIKLLTASL